MNLIRRFVQTDKRSQKAYKNIAGLFVLKGFTIVILYIQVPLLLDYLDQTRYGIWITLSTFLNWFSLFDIGLGHGLRNRLAESSAKNEFVECRSYVSTTYFFVAIIFISIFLIFGTITFFIDWSVVLNTPSSLKTELHYLVLIVSFFFCIRFVTKLIQSVAYAKQEPALTQLLKFLGSLFALIGILFLIKFAESKLLYLGILLAGSPVIVGIIFSYQLFKTRYHALRPSLKLVNFSKIRKVMNLGVKFFMIQISTVLLYQTNNIIIAQLIGPKKVTEYNIVFKYYSIIIILFTLIITPYWSAITDAFVKKEFAWIKRSMKKLQKLWLGIILLTIIFYFSSNTLVRLWVGNTIPFDSKLYIVIAIYTVFYTYNILFGNFFSGTGKLVVQVYRIVIMGIVHVPLAIFLCKKYGVVGVMYSMVLLNIITFIVNNIQYDKIINLKAKGIWAK